MKTEIIYELDNTDESLQSISSGNIICITPTKYKNRNKGKSDSECQCIIPKRRTCNDNDQHKSLQICPSILKAICRSVNTMSQERICSPNCTKSSPDGSRSCESLEYPCKPLKPKAEDPRENSSEASLTCPSKKSSCPARPPPCPGAGDKPCPSYPPKPCPSRKEPTRDEGNSSRSRRSKSDHDRPRKECPGLSRRDSRNAAEDRDSAQENEPILLPVSIKSSSPLQEANNNIRTSRRSEYSSGELQTQDEAPSMLSNTPPKSPSTRNDNRQPDIQVYTCTTERSSGMKQNDFTEQKKCGCSFESCKCSQTTTHEEKDVQCPAFRQCTCQTEPKEDANVQCNCKDNAGVSCECAKTQQEQEDPCQCKKSSSSSSSTTDSGSGSFMSCICCKKEKILKNLISRIPLCDPCQQVNQKNFYPHNYSDPLHSCICYNLVNRDVLFQFKQTLTNLERLDIYQQYCEVLKNCKCCKKCGCKCKLPKKYKNGCAYFLKLEDACPNKHCEEEGTNSDSIYEEEEEDESDNYLPEVTVKVPNCRGSCARKKNNGDKHETKKYMSCPSIQNYLCTMKPDFVARAEHRRRILREATSQREENSDNRKLNFIEKINYLSQKKRNDKINSENNGFKPCGYQAKTYCVFDIELTDSPKMVRPRVFKSFKEMKDLTRRRYLHLTEVKSKKNIYREKRLKEANRLLANTFTRRLQRSTLKGNVDIPLNVKVVSY